MGKSIFISDLAGYLIEEGFLYMSTQTNNLNLVKPELSDNIQQTIMDLAGNFQKLDDASDIITTELPTSNQWDKGSKIYFSNVDIGDYIGAVNTRAGKAAPKWLSYHEYSIGDEVVPTVNNGHYYVCNQSGVSAPFEPLWLLATGTVTEDTRNKTAWQPSKSYSLHDVVVPSISNDRFYVCTVAGTSGTNEPIWSTINGTATSDNSVVWMTYRIVKWRESGISVNFRPFGKIE